MNNSDKSEHFRKINITLQMLKWAFEAESVAYTVCQHLGIDTSDYSFGYIAGWSSGKDMRELKSSLDTIRKMASGLITGIEGALRELQLNREMEQSKECILLIQNEDLTEFSLVNVRGMDTQELVAALSNMSEDDKLSIQAYLESKGHGLRSLVMRKRENLRNTTLMFVTILIRMRLLM